MMAQTVTIRGARGSMPVSGVGCARYGANTTCLTVETDEAIVVIDAGTGVVPFGALFEAGVDTRPITLLFTHLHLDHLLGLPRFAPVYDPASTLRLMAWGGPENRPWQEDLRTFFGRPYWPVRLFDAGSRLTLDSLPSVPGELDVAGIRVSWCPVWHTDPCLAYKFVMSGWTMVVATDLEYGDPELGPPFEAFCHGVDVLVHDSQYTPAEYAQRRGWGHAHWGQAAELARRVGAGQLVLTHHEVGRTDDEIDEMVKQAQAVFAETRAASEGMVLGPGARDVE